MNETTVNKTCESVMFNTIVWKKLINLKYGRHYCSFLRAWISRGDSPATDGILNRIEDMTGLSTASAEPFHVLNYGVGGHYDAHVDFFDLANVSPVCRIIFLRY